MTFGAFAAEAQSTAEETLTRFEAPAAIEFAFLILRLPSAMGPSGIKGAGWGSRKAN